MMNAMSRLAVGVALSMSAMSVHGATSFSQRADVQRFVDDVATRHGFDRGELGDWLKRIEIRQDILDAIARPAEHKPWFEYRPIFVTDGRIAEGVAFWRAHREVLARAEREYGVPPAIVTAIIGVETRYGRYRGKYRVMDALATLGFDYPPRSAFFRSELEHFLLLSREEGFEPLAITGSYAGAMGEPQFISSSYRAYAVDFDEDGIRNLFDNTADAIGSVANYLARHGWARGETIVHPVARVTASALPERPPLKPNMTVGQWRAQGVEVDLQRADDALAALIPLETRNGMEYWLGLRNFYAITRYNHSPLYAMAVYQLSEGIRQRIEGDD